MNAQKKKKRKTFRRVLILLIALAIAGGGFIYFTKTAPTASATEYTAYTATVGSISNAISLSGTFAAQKSATYAASAAATVREIYVSPGQDVKEGDKLLRLSTGETVKAGFDGRVNSLFVAADDSVAAGDSLLQVADFEHLIISVNIDEYDISNVAVGQQCLVTATAAGQVMMSAIDSISYISSVSTGSVAYYTATVKVDAPSGVYPGMQASVVITQEEAKDAVILKQSALYFDPYNQAYVLMDNGTGEKEQVTVEVGVSNGYYVEIKSGLNDGDVVYAEDDGTSSQTNGMNMNMGMMFGVGGGEMRQFQRRNSESGGEMPSSPSGGGSGGRTPGGN